MGYQEDYGLFSSLEDFSGHGPNIKGTLMGTPNREPQEHSRNLIQYKDPGRYIPIIFLLYSWRSLFGVPIRVPLNTVLKGDHPAFPKSMDSNPGSLEAATSELSIVEFLPRHE